MKAKARKSCPNCRRLQALLDAQEALLDAQEALQRSRPPSRVSSATCCGAEGFLDLLQAAVLRHRQAAQAGPAGGSRATPHRGTTGSPQARTPRLSGRIDQRCVGRLSPRSLSLLRTSFAAHADDRAPSDPAGRHQGRAAGDPGASRSSRVVFSLSEAYEAPLPIGIERGGLVGPRLTTVIAYLKGVCHASFSTIRKFIRDVVHLTISRATVGDHR